MAESEYEKLVKKAKGIGIDISVIMDELDRRVESKTTSIARNIIDQMPSLKPNIDELATAVAEKIQTNQVDINEIISKVVEKIPDTGEVERKRILKETSEQITTFLSNIDQKIGQMVKPLVNAALLEQKDGMLKDVQEEMNRRQDEYLATARGEGTGTEVVESKSNNKGSNWGGIPWDTLMPFLEKMIDTKQDPLAGIDRLIALREKMAVFDPPSPDVKQQTQIVSQGFIEGIKIRGLIDKGMQVKKLSGPPGGPSKRLVKSSGLHPAIEAL